nr:MAG TPA: hypothetical protein [Caudoviricetes sp.]
MRTLQEQRGRRRLPFKRRRRMPRGRRLRSV